MSQPTTRPEITLLRPVFFMENFTGYFTPKVEDGTIVVRLAVPKSVALQMIAVADIGTAAATLLADGPDNVPESLEIGGDELTGEQIAAAYGKRFDKPARYEEASLDTLGAGSDTQKMFSWLHRGPSSYKADIPATKALVPDLHDFQSWLTESGAIAE